MKNIENLVVGEKINDMYVLIQTSQKGTTADGSPYLSLLLQDQTGLIDSKIWNATEDQINDYVSGKVVKIIDGEVVEYRKNPQLKIRRLELHPTMDAAHFLPSAPIKQEQLKEDIMRYILQIKNKNIYDIVYNVIKKYENEYFVYPAASRNHHEYVSGLAHHVKCMLDLGHAICNLYPDLNRDLLYAGIILHDFGKVIELSGIISTTYTTPGKLLGHISIAHQEISNIARELNILEEEEVMLLQHMVLSHHGKLEFGSPKLPMIREAEVLNYIDNLDARIVMMNKALNDTEYGEFTNRVYALESRTFYKTPLYKK